MKKLVVILTVGVLAGSVWAMAEKPVAAKAPADAKACAVKDAAACCTKDGSCKMGAQKAACPACTAAGGTCAVCKAKADAGKAACKVKADAEKTACDAQKAVKEGGTCPLKK